MIRFARFLIIYCLFLFQSCGLLPVERQAFIRNEVRNESNYVLAIQAFNKGVDRGKFTLESKEKIEFRAGTTRSGPYTIFWGTDPQSVDSVVISFDNRRFIIQYCDGNPLLMANRGEVCPFIDKNIMGYYGQTEVNKRINKEFIAYKFLYIFDNTDYEKAIEL